MVGSLSLRLGSVGTEPKSEPPPPSKAPPTLLGAGFAPNGEASCLGVAAVLALLLASSPMESVAADWLNNAEAGSLACCSD